VGGGLRYPAGGGRKRNSGVITDRDLSIAMATKNKLPSDILVEEVLVRRHLEACAPDEDVKTALAKMRDNQIRRLPVIDAEGRLEGILSINDLIRHSKADSHELSDQDVLTAMKAICSDHAMA
jgi:predicted transcriptional regulator